MSTEAQDFIEFWIENSIHAREHYGIRGAAQGVDELAQRLVESAGRLGFSENELIAAVGNLTFYVRSKLAEANEGEQHRLR